MYKHLVFIILAFCIFWNYPAQAALPKKQANTNSSNNTKIKEIEKSLEKLLEKKKDLETEAQKIKRLIKVQKLEIKLSNLELQQKEDEIKEIEIRRDSIKYLIKIRNQEIQKQFANLYEQGKDTSFSMVSNKDWKKRKMNFLIMSHLIKDKKGEIKSLEDLDKELFSLNRELKEKKSILLGRIKNLEHRKSILALNKKIILKKLSKNKSSYSKNLRDYRRAVELKKKIITAVQSRIETSQNPPLSLYHGKLDLPAIGKIIQDFGKKYDKKTNLYTFHKGIQIKVEPGAIVRSVFPGKIVYSGSLGGYRQLIIIDHGKEYYSLVAQLGELSKKEGDSVSQGDILGRSSLDGSPLYFELRKRHIALDPKPWFKQAIRR